MGIGNIGWTEFIVILAIALIFFGPRRLPGIAHTLGKSLREFQKALNEVRSEIAQAGREADLREAERRTAQQRPSLPPGPHVSGVQPDSEGVSNHAAGTAEPRNSTAELTPDTATGPVATAAALSVRAVAGPAEERRDVEEGHRAPEREGDRDRKPPDTARPPASIEDATDENATENATDENATEGHRKSEPGQLDPDVGESPRTLPDAEGHGSAPSREGNRASRQTG